MIDEGEKVAQDEARKIAQHETVKGKVREGVHTAIEHDAVRPSSDEKEEVERVSRGLKKKAIREVMETETDLERGRRAARLSQVVDYVFALLYGMIGLQIVLELLGAREGSGFKQLLNQLTSPFLKPFRGLMPDPEVGGFQLYVSYIIGLVVYLLLHMAIRGLLRLVVVRKTTV